MGSVTEGPARPAHPWPIKLMHWIGAVAILCMMFSGFAIYDASPDLPFVFPHWALLGGWLAAGIAWHISAMWVLFVDGIAYLVYGFASGHFQRDIGVPSPLAVGRDLGRAVTLRLGHSLGHYNAVQRALYLVVLIAIVLAVATGLSIWKPVQFGALSALFGGYPLARNIHLGCMLVIAAFLVVHVALVALNPRTLLAMVASVPAEREAAE